MAMMQSNRGSQPDRISSPVASRSPDGISRRGVLRSLAFIPLATVFPWQSYNNAKIELPEAVPLGNSLARAAALGGRYFGAAARIDQIRDDAKLREIVLRECSYVTPEFHMNWNCVEWNQGEFSFAPVDDLVSFAVRHKLKIHGHTLLWDQSTPGWAKESMSDTADWKIVRKHFASIISRYRGQIEQWNIVNEPIDIGPRGDGLRVNTFLKAFGPDYIRLALEEARILDPVARLIINDYGFDYETYVERDRRSMFLRLLERLKKSNVPLDGVGIQAHLDLSKGPIKEKTIQKFLNEIANFGLDITISELDVKEHDLSLSLQERDRRVADEAKRYLSAALSQRAVKGVITWGLSDRHSWLQSAIANGPARNGDGHKPDLNRGLPFDASLDRKVMYQALQDAFTASSRI
jgi:endo-1,4-beta-xylanase